MWDRYHNAFLYDSLRLGMVSEVGYPSEVREILAGNARTLTDWVNDARVEFVAGGGADGASVLDLQLLGFAGANLVAIQAGGRPGSVRLDKNQNGVLDPADPAVPGTWDETSNRFVPNQPISLLASWRTDLAGLRPGIQHYRVFVTGSGSSGLLPVLQNRYTGESVTPTAGELEAPVRASMSFSPWQYPEEHGRLHRLRGTVRLSEDLRVGRLDTLIIEPGTTLLLGPDVSIESRGRVIAAGTADRPIVLTRADAVRPWGAFALLGHGADSSLFRHVTWEWGGGDLVDRVEYIGMVNFHRVDGVVVENSIFRDNLRSDDTFHALHADIILRGSQFNRANSDAVDFDVATGIIEDNLFEDTGGDAVDLMASTPLIRRNRIYRSRDKGISVGENSRPVVFDNYIEGSRRGIEIKDRSDPVALNNTLVRNGVGIYSDRKNWRYGGGGFGTFINNTLRDNRTALEQDVFSRITLANVSGLDSTFENVAHTVTGMDHLTGLYRSYGIEWPASGGRDPATAREVPPIPALISARFEEDFESIDDGWLRSGGVGLLLKDNRTLHATAETKPGMIGRAVAWDLRQTGPATLVMEISATDMDSVRLTLVSPEGNVTAPVAVSGSGSIFRLVTVKLPARRYTAILLAVAPRPRIEKVVNTGWTELKPGQLWLRGYDVYRDLPAAPTVRQTGF
jgi:parallel beta-helix repeat protein